MNTNLNAVPVSTSDYITDDSYNLLRPVVCDDIRRMPHLSEQLDINDGIKRIPHESLIMYVTELEQLLKRTTESTATIEKETEANAKRTKRIHKLRRKVCKLANVIKLQYEPKPAAEAVPL